ncbi:hypothetical protein F511_29738 [Dorcoceras hygrometricum]|uniref:Uncharacterized protein n=1 Tax=Dorcoceras hygrometricum TaxID=472368 RepID=A0A2Z7CD98_9LAMI|nr:hypothetical protein F511_29738 [Dorcoceras hygrometricum]
MIRRRLELLARECSRKRHVLVNIFEGLTAGSADARVKSDQLLVWENSRRSGATSFRYVEKLRFGTNSEGIVSNALRLENQQVEAMLT